jgi:C4-dicarboxylate-specific signal transduction histidine kinase
VLTSVNVSAHVLESRLRQSRTGRVADIAQLLQENQADLAGFFGRDAKARMLPDYVRELAAALAAERAELLAELARLGASVEHIKNVVAMQQSYAGGTGVLEQASLALLADDALRMHEEALRREGVLVLRDYAQVGLLPLDRTRVMQVLVNLVENARQAMEGMPGERRLALAIRRGEGWVDVSVSDTGCGIATENVAKIFSHGFTTRQQGHGFGLHSCAVAAREMGGSLAVHSDGPGLGTRFTLRLSTAQHATRTRGVDDVASEVSG